MTRKFAEIRRIHGQINNDILRLDRNTGALGLYGLDRNYFNQQKEKLEIWMKPLTEPAWFDGYQDRLDYCLRDIDYLFDPNKNINEDVRKRVLLLTLLAAQKIVEHSLDYLATQSENEQANRLPEIIPLLRRIEDGLEIFFPGREKYFNLSLNDLSTEYEEAYRKNHGNGLFKFFTLPVKSFFKHSSREEELQFLEAFNDALLVDNLNPAERELVKLSALNLVRSKLQSEIFGGNSLLFQIINERLDETDNGNNTEIQDGFLDFCAQYNIVVPEALVDCYEKSIANP